MRSPIVALVLIGQLKIETPKSLIKINGNIRIDAVTIKRRTRATPIAFDVGRTSPNPKITQAARW
jgi:hypothetical protein